MRKRIYKITLLTFSLAVLMILFQPFPSFAQTRVTGQVTDEGKKPIPGATVAIKGTNTMVSTDKNGNFSISASSGATLIVTYVGYTTQEVGVADRNTINFQMEPASKSLNDVVVVAYGSQSKRNITGAIQTINDKELKDLPAAQLTQKLQGKLAGVQINQTTGIPGQGMSIRVRGQASITAGSDPLYVVDGFPITGNIANINPDEIESISVLKDASSTSLYGSRAANGVVIVTTKSAKQGATNISVSAYAGIQSLPEKGKPEHS